MINLVFYIALILTAVGAGQFILRRTGFVYAHQLERVCFSVAIGLGGLIVGLLVLGMCHLLYEWTIYVLLLGMVVLGGFEVPHLLERVRYHLRRDWFNIRSVYFWVMTLAAVGVGLNLIQAMAPPSGATDPLAYQLALPRIFLQKHYLSFEPTITGALYPTNMGLLYAMSIELRNGTFAQIIHWGMGVMCMLSIVGFTQRHFSWKAGIWGAALFSFTPVLVIFASKGYVDVGLAFFQFVAFWAVFNWLEERTTRNLLLAAVLTGLAMGIKHQGLATLFVGGLIVIGTLIRSREQVSRIATSLALYGGVALLLAAPWYIRAYVMAGNPIWPLANDFFGGAPFRLTPIILAGANGDPHVQGVLEKLALTGQWLRDTWTAMSPWTWTFYPPGGQKAIGVYYVALLPGVLLGWRNRKLMLMIAFCAFYYLILVRLLHMNPRYGLMFFAFLSVVCGCVCQMLLESRYKIVSWVFLGATAATMTFNLSWLYAMVRPVFPVSFGREPEELFLKRTVDNYSIFNYANQHLPESSKVLLQGIVKGYYCDRPYMWDHPYQAVLNYENYATPELLLARLHELGITHIVRMIYIPPYRQEHFPQYFQDPYHEAFRKKYLTLLQRDQFYALFAINDNGQP